MSNTTFSISLVGSILHAGNDSNVSIAYNSVISDIKNIIGGLPTLPTLLP